MADRESGREPGGRVRLELSGPEAAMLRDVLESYLGDLRMEVAGTDRLEVREALKRREAFLKDLLGRLRAGG